MKKYSKIIGIDPDVEKSGVVVFDVDEKDLIILNLTFVEIIQFFEVQDKNTLVVIEKGENNKALFTASKSLGSLLTRLKIAMNIGKNFQLTENISDICKLNKLDFKFYTPTSGKLNHDYLVSILKNRCNFSFNRSNQETRDAIRCILSFIL